MSARDRLVNRTTQSNVYYTHSQFDHHVAYKLTEIVTTKSNYSKEDALVANFEITRTSKGYFYLPNEFTADENTKLTPEMVKEINDEIKWKKEGKEEGSNWYIIHQGYIPNTQKAQFDIWDEKKIADENIRLYVGENMKSPVTTPTKRVGSEEMPHTPSSKKFREDH